MTKLDRAGIVDLYETLNRIKVALEEPQHRWCAAQMRRKLKALAEDIIEERDDAQKKAPVAFNDARTALLHRCAKKDPNGRPIINGANFMIDEALQDDWTKSLAALREEHKEAVETWEAAVEKINAWLREEVEIPDLGGRLKLSWFNKMVSQDWLETLLDHIDDDTVSTAAPVSKDAKKKK